MHAGVLACFQSTCFFFTYEKVGKGTEKRRNNEEEERGNSWPEAAETPEKQKRKQKQSFFPTTEIVNFCFFFLRTLSDMEFHLSLERKKNDSTMKRGGENPIRFHILRHWFHVDFVLHLLHTRYRTRGVRNTCVWEGKNRREIFFCCQTKISPGVGVWVKKFFGPNNSGTNSCAKKKPLNFSLSKTQKRI